MEFRHDSSELKTCWMDKLELKTLLEESYGRLHSYEWSEAYFVTLIDALSFVFLVNAGP